VFSVSMHHILTYKNIVFCAQFIIPSKLFTRASLEITKLCFHESRLSTVQIDYNFNFKVRIHSIFVPISICKLHRKQKGETFMFHPPFPFLSVYFRWKCKLSTLNSHYTKLFKITVLHIPEQLTEE
jgi:hypothetical protein